MRNTKFRIHVLGIPHTITNSDFLACAYTQKALKFCKMMANRGHTIFHYGHEDSKTMANEDVAVLSRKTYKKVYGKHDYKGKATVFWNNQDEAYKEFYANAINEIKKRKKPNDIILPFWGWGVKPICDAHSDLITIEPGIGYSSGHFASYKIFESYAIYHAYCGLKNINTPQQNNYDIVIPNYFDLDEFEYNENKKDYFLFIGRVNSGKGVHIAEQVAEATGIKLKVAGQLDPSYKNRKWSNNVEFVGYADVEKRKELMKNAKGSFLPSQYVEPFGGVQIENLLSGTPTITTDWGAFAENNIEGVTGYRCRTFEDYVRAVRNIQNGKIKSIDCLNYGKEFSLENIAYKYENFFRKVTDIYGGKGWYEIWDESLYDKKWLKLKKNNHENKKLKILYYGDCGLTTSMGIIHRDIKKLSKDKIKLDLLSWEDSDGCIKFHNEEVWRNYDLVLSDHHIYETEEIGWKLPKDVNSFKRKLVPFYHTELDIESSHFNQGGKPEWFITPIAGINKKIVNQIKEKGFKAVLLPIGVDSKRFKPFKKVNKIKRVGFIGSQKQSKEWNKIKRPQLFDNICKIADVEPIYIDGRENNWKMYEDIDLVICTSTIEGNPMAFLECVASKIPFISTKVGIVNEYKEVKTFNTVDEAVKLINELNENKDNIQEYVDKLYDVVIPERKWENVLEEYWIPYFNELNSGNFDFIEIGTSDFDSLSIDLPNKRGLLIEPIKQYLDNLPNNDNQIKANYAISDKSEKVKIFYVKPEDIKKYNLPDWVKGCNTINKPHPTIKKLLGDNHDNIITVDLIECITWKQLIKKFNIKSIGYLKIDTEGHDYLILNEYLKVCKVNPNLLASKIVFENNTLSDKNKISDIISKFKMLGYNGKAVGEDYELNMIKLNEKPKQVIEHEHI